MREDARYSGIAHEIIKRIETGEQTATSTLVIAQVCGYMKWKKKADLIQVFLTFLESLASLAKADTTFSDFVQGDTLLQKEIATGQKNSKSWDDFVIAAQMHRLGLEEIYSNDYDFDSMNDVKRIFG
jgi:predicted nucleic acid-binding protein